MPRSYGQRALCHPTRKHLSLGMCKHCYRSRPAELRKAQIYSKAYRAAHPEKVKEAQKDYALRKMYGISLEEYKILLEGQDGRCAICRVPAEMLKRALAVDHNHKTGCVRGLLCGYCNTAVGQIERVGVEHLDRVGDYIRNDGTHGV